MDNNQFEKKIQGEIFTFTHKNSIFFSNKMHITTQFQLPNNFKNFFFKFQSNLCPNINFDLILHNLEKCIIRTKHTKTNYSIQGQIHRQDYRIRKLMISPQN